VAMVALPPAPTWRRGPVQGDQHRIDSRLLGGAPAAQRVGDGAAHRGQRALDIPAARAVPPSRRSAPPRGCPARRRPGRCRGAGAARQHDLHLDGGNGPGPCGGHGGVGSWCPAGVPFGMGRTTAPPWASSRPGPRAERMRMALS
jgi:hypothetical protein